MKGCIFVFCCFADVNMPHNTRLKSQYKIYTCKKGVKENGVGRGGCSRYGSPYVVTGTSKRNSTSPGPSPNEIQVHFDDTRANVTGLDRLCEAVDLVSQGVIADLPRKGKKRRFVKDDPEESPADSNQGSLQTVTREECSLVNPFRAIRVKKVIDAYSLPNPVIGCQAFDILGMSPPSQRTMVNGMNFPGAPFSLVPPFKYLNRMVVPLPVAEYSMI